MAQKPINAAGIPQPQLNAGWLELAAGWLNDDGTTIQTAGSDLKATWHGLSGVYHAPEAPDLFAAMDPVATATESFASDVGQVSKALKNFAAEAGPLAATLASTQADASTFASSVAGNDKWDHDTSLVNQNNALIHTVNTTVVQYEAAERRAANAIEALIGGTQFHTITSAADAKDPYAYGYDSIPDNTKGTPWGASVAKKDGCAKTALKDVGDVFVGAYEWGKGLVTGIGDLVGLGGWDKFKQSWEGMAFLATLVSGPIGWAAGSAMFGGPEAYAKRTEAFGKGLLDWDEWKTHPFRAATQVILNVGTLFVPGADGAGAAADIAKGADYAADAGKAADLADAGKLAKTINITKDAFATLNTITDPLHWLGQLPKVLDFANGMKFPELVGTGSKEASTLENAMKDWDHEPAPVGAHDPGTGTHDPGTGPGAHDPGTGPGAHDPGTGGGLHDPGTGAHDPGTGTGAHDPGTGTGSAHPAGPTADDSIKGIADRNDPRVQQQVDAWRQHAEPQLQAAADTAWKDASDPTSQRYQDWVTAHGHAPSAQTMGTWAHTDLENWVANHAKGVVDPASGYRIRPEISFDPLGEVRRGTPGSVRPDIVLEREVKLPGTPVPVWEVVRVYDLKTGSARMTAAWIKAVEKATGVNPNDVVVVRPR